MYKVPLLLFSIVYIGLVTPECSNIPAGIYCTNLLDNNDSTTLIFQTDEENPNHDVKAAYLRNSSGEINNSTFSLFPNIESLDIQFSSIHKFSPESATLHTLYIIHNLEFPKFTNDFLENCCKNFKILFIVGNSDLEIDSGAFKTMENLTHLTISSQNITHLTKDILQGLSKLSYLNLKYNGINNIDENAFEDLSELNHLVLSHNNFKTIESKTFKKLNVLETLELYDLNIDKFNTTIFSKQKELKHLGVPTSLIKQKLELNQLTKTFPMLETIGVQNEDKDDEDIAKFMKMCKASGFYVQFSNNRF